MLADGMSFSHARKSEYAPQFSSRFGVKKISIFDVTVEEEIQHKRVMARKGMTKEVFEMILSKQTPDAEKRERADFIIETKSLEHVNDEVQKLIDKLSGKTADA
jgi:dephospho-CoA kinase